MATTSKKPNPFKKMPSKPSKADKADKGSAYEKGSGNNASKDMMGQMSKCMAKGKSMKQCRKELGG